MKVNSRRNLKIFADFGIQVDISTSGNVKVPCPQCLHERKNKSDKSLSVNLDMGVWNCHHCGWSGHLGNNNNHIVQNSMKSSSQKNYKIPKLNYVVPMPEGISNYLTHDRGISKDIIKRNKVCFSGKAIQFPFFMNGQLVNIKHRTMDKKFWQEKGARKSVFGYDDIQNVYLVKFVFQEFNSLFVLTIFFLESSSVVLTHITNIFTDASSLNIFLIIAICNINFIITCTNFRCIRLFFNFFFILIYLFFFSTHQIFLGRFECSKIVISS